VRAYCRCTSGHYFQGECCPFDGWSSAASRELAAALARLAGQGQKPSLASLRKVGLSQGALERVVVIEFGTARSAFEALAPKEYVVNGEAKPLLILGSAFK
jgi:hypothetical protein